MPINKGYRQGRRAGEMSGHLMTPTMVETPNFDDWDWGVLVDIKNRALALLQPAPAEADKTEATR